MAWGQTKTKKTVGGDDSRKPKPRLVRVRGAIDVLAGTKGREEPSRRTSRHEPLARQPGGMEWTPSTLMSGGYEGGSGPSRADGI